MGFFGLPDGATPRQVLAAGYDVFPAEAHGYRPHTYVYLAGVLALAEFAVDSGHAVMGPCMPDEHQKIGGRLIYPAVVYSVVGRESLDQLGEQSISYTTLFSVQSRALASAGGYDVADQIDELVLTHLHSGGRLDGLGDLFDEFTIEQGVNRITSAVLIT